VKQLTLSRLHSVLADWMRAIRTSALEGAEAHPIADSRRRRSALLAGARPRLAAPSLVVTRNANGRNRATSPLHRNSLRIAFLSSEPYGERLWNGGFGAGRAIPGAKTEWPRRVENCHCSSLLTAPSGRRSYGLADR